MINIVHSLDFSWVARKFIGWKKRVPLSIAIENVSLQHVFCPQHLHKGKARKPRMKTDKKIDKYNMQINWK